MAVDWERRLLSKIIETGDYERVLAVVEPEFFGNRELRNVYELIIEEAEKYGGTPSIDIVREEIRSTIKSNKPMLDFETGVVETTDRLVAVVVKKFKHRALQALVAEVENLTETGKEEEAIQRALALTERLNQIGGRETVTDLADVVEADFERLVPLPEDQRDQLSGIDTGMSLLNKATSGLQGGMLITLTGVIKSGKSTLLLRVAQAAYEAGFSVMFVTLEMSDQEQRERLYAMLAETSHHKLRTRSMDDDDFEGVRETVLDIVLDPECDNKFHFVYETAAALTVSGIVGHAKRLKPDLILVDGAYLMQDEHGEAPNTWSALTNITRGFKRAAQNLNVPVVIATQSSLNKVDKNQGLTAASLMYSQSFGQDSDVMIGVEKPYPDMQNVNRLKILAARNYPNAEQYVDWDWDKGTFREIDDPMGGEDEAPAPFGMPGGWSPSR